jgi:phosphoribosylformylglycinamidine cyclo-ligase
MNKKKVTYSQVGDNYDTKDPIKKLAQKAALSTGHNLTLHGFSEIKDSRGESAYVWKQGNIFMASVIEGLGTKNLVADAMYQATGKSYYEVIGHDTVATVINDLITVGAQPLVMHAYWAVEDNSFLQDERRMRDLTQGWKAACNIAGASWGGGETPTMKGIMQKNTCELGGSAVGIITKKNHLLTDTNLKAGDAIILLKSSGINANGLSLARAIAKKLARGYMTKLSDRRTYGEHLLQKTNIYASLIQDLFQNGISLHYISNITGHGMRKIMRARKQFRYVIENIHEPNDVFPFMQKYAGLTNTEMYGTFNMGMDYALFLPESDVARTLHIIKKHKFTGIKAGYIEKGEREVIINPKNITFTADSLDLR